MGYKITGFMIAIVIVGIFIGISSLFLSDINSKYTISYDNNSINNYNKLSSIVNTTEEVKGSVEEIKEKSGVFDIIGGLFSSAYSSLKVVLKSFTAFEGLTAQASEDLNLGAGGKIIIDGIIAIVLIIIFIGIMVAIAVKVKEGGL